MTEFYNRKRNEKSYKVSDEIMLSSRHIRIRKACKKHADKFIGPFKVVAIIGKNAYRRDFPKSDGRIHPTFHVALLKPYQRRDLRVC